MIRVDESYFNAYITEILTELKAWIDTGGNIAIKKVLFSNNSLLFYKNPEGLRKFSRGISAAGAAETARKAVTITTLRTYRLKYARTI